VVALDPEQRPDAREQLVVVERLLDEVVRTRLDRLHLLVPGAGCDHDHGQHGRLFALAKPPADRITVHLGHHDVEEHDVGIRALNELKGRRAVGGRHHLVAVRLEHGLEEPHVLGDVVDHEARRVAAAAHRPSQYCRTAPRSSMMFTGFER
jgi:hypothetical protein